MAEICKKYENEDDQFTNVFQDAEDETALSFENLDNDMIVSRLK